MRKKHIGSRFEYEEQRDANLMKVYREALSLPEPLSQSEICHYVSMHGADRFWVSEERALAVISRMYRNYHATLSTMYPLKRKMYREIFARVNRLMKERPCLSRIEAVSEVVASPAPEFYLTPGSVKVILCRIKKKQWYQQRKHRLRHLF